MGILTRTPTPIDHAELVKFGEKWLKGKGCGVTFSDEFKALTITGERPDVIGWSDGLSKLIEAKTTRADFLADMKKSFRKNPEQGMGDWRFYLCPEGVIKIEDLPDGWGLLYLRITGSAKKIIEVHGVPSNCNWWTKKPFSGNRQCENQMLYSALRRLTISGHFQSIYRDSNKSETTALGSEA